MKCEMITGWKVNLHGDPGEEVPCGALAVALMGTVPICAQCIARDVGHDDELARDVRPVTHARSFGGVLEKIRNGHAVARAGWLARKMWIVLDHPEHDHDRFVLEDGRAKRRDRWQPSHQDLLAFDWVVVARPDGAREWGPTL